MMVKSSIAEGDILDHANKMLQFRQRLLTHASWPVLLTRHRMQSELLPDCLLYSVVAVESLPSSYSGMLQKNHSKFARCELY